MTAEAYAVPLFRSSANSCHGRSDQAPDAAPEGEASHEDGGIIIARRLPAERDRRRRPSVKQARGLLAGERNPARPIVLHLRPECRGIDARLQGLIIHSRTALAHVGEADAEVE